MSQEMSLMELTPRGSRDLGNNHQYRKKNHVAPIMGGSHDKSTSRDHHRATSHLLLEAARNGSPHELEALLGDGVSPNVVDGGGRSPLHLVLTTGCSCDVCVRDAEACLVLLLSSNGVDVNLQDEIGNTGLHIAIDNQLSKCAQMLISYGADVSLRNDQGENVVQLMAQKMPQCLLHLLNESIYIDQYDPHHEKCVVKMDLGPLFGHSSFSRPPRLSSTEVDKDRPKKKLTKNEDGEMTLLVELLESQRVSREPIFTHPLVQVFLHLKWKRVRSVFWTSFIVYMFWVILYTSYVLQVYVFSCPCQMFKRPSTLRRNKGPTQDGHEFGNDTPDNLTRCEIETGLSLKVILIIVSTFLLLLAELGRLIITPRVYLRSWLNLGHWTLIGCVFATTIPNLQAQTSISNLQYQVAAFTVFFVWVLVLPQIGRLPSLAKYVEIFGHVVKCFGSFILTFASLFMGFALGFCILFFGDDMSPFANFFHSTVKVLVMMVGEVDYMTTFYDDNNNTQQQQPIMGHLLYATFVILVCIILMNLFVGLTVSDIQMLERKAEFSRTCRLIAEIFHFESVVLSKRVPKIIRRFLKRQFLLNESTHSFRPNDPKDSTLPGPLAHDILLLAENSFRKARSQRCFRRTTNHHHMEPELVEIQTYFPSMDKPEHGSPRHSTTSSSPSSQSSSPLETNSLDLDVNQAHSRGPFRPWASCMDHTNYHA